MLRDGFLLVWALLMVAGGGSWIVAPERTLRWTYRWQDRYARWLSFGLLKKAFGPIVKDETAIRVMPWVGSLCVLIGVATLVWLFMRWS
jgi:hypothetical protein